MPVPLSFAFWAMNAAQRFHTMPAYERPFRLRTVYFARIASYATVGLIVLVQQRPLTDTFVPKTFEEWVTSFTNE
jgi:hypothetical protein